MSKTKNMNFFSTLGKWDYTFLSLLLLSLVVVWCLTSSFTNPIEHLSCPLLKMI